MLRLVAVFYARSRKLNTVFLICIVRSGNDCRARIEIQYRSRYGLAVLTMGDFHGTSVYVG